MPRNPSRRRLSPALVLVPAVIGAVIGSGLVFQDKVLAADGVTGRPSSDARPSPRRVPAAPGQPAVVPASRDQVPATAPDAATEPALAAAAAAPAETNPFASNAGMRLIRYGRQTRLYGIY